MLDYKKIYKVEPEELPGYYLRSDKAIERIKTGKILPQYPGKKETIYIYASLNGKQRRHRLDILLKKYFSGIIDVLTP
jgi:hypothetical protein